MSVIYLENKTKNWTMDTKHEEQIKPIIEEWQFSNSLVSLLGILAPAAFLAILLGHSGTFIEFLLNGDYWKIKGPQHTKIPKKPQDIHFTKWLLNFLSRLKYRNDSKGGIGTQSPRDIWRDGSILCNLVNMIVPGACKDPRSHRLQTPQHGQKLVYEYLDINPIFTPLELSQKSLSQTQEKKFSKYLNEIYQILKKDNDNINNMKFSTDYVARGMGLVVAQQNKKSTFYIYPIPKRYPNSCDLDILIKGPCGNNGKITIPSISQSNQKCQPSTEYKRSLYMSSKVNSISPTLQGSSFLRKLSLSSDDTRSEIDIRVKLSTNRIKVSYVPENIGIYEISFVTRGCHIVGSPYSVPVELATGTNYCSNDTDSENEETFCKYTYRKKKVISRIVDFIDEKMLLQDDGTLVKITDNHAKNEDLIKSTKILNTKDSNINKKTLPRNNENNKILNKPNIKITTTNEDLHLVTSKEDHHILNNTKISEVDEKNNNNKVNAYSEETQVKMNLYKLPKTNCNNSYLMQNIEKGNNNSSKNQCLESLEINTSKNSVSASFTSVNDPQIFNSIDPTLKSKVQDPSLNLMKTMRKDLKKENHVIEESFHVTSSIHNEEINNSNQIFDHNTDPNDNPSSNEVVENNLINSNSMKKSFKKIEAILEPFDTNISNNKLGLVEKQKQFWIEKTSPLINNTSESVKHLKPAKTLKSSKSNEEIREDPIVLPFEGIVESNIKLFEIKLNPESPTQNKTSFKIDIPKFNLNETIIVRNIEIVTKNEKDIIKLESLEERKSKFLQACNKPVRPKRTRNKVPVNRNFFSNKKEDNNIAVYDQTDYTKLNTLNLEKNIQKSDDIINTEHNVSFRRKYRFKRAKLYFQSLEKPSDITEKEEISDKHLGIISIKAESDLNNKNHNNNNIQQNLCESNSDPENHLRNSSKSNLKLPRSESDSCILNGNRKTPVKLSERFQVTGLFRDVLEDSRFIGLPNKKAVVASLASLDTDCNQLMDHLNSRDINEIDYFEKRNKKCDNNENSIPGFQKDFPHIPNKSHWKHRSRNKNNSEISELIPGRKLLGGNVGNLFL